MSAREVEKVASSGGPKAAPSFWSRARAWLGLGRRESKPKTIEDLLRGGLRELHARAKKGEAGVGWVEREEVEGVHAEWLLYWGPDRFAAIFDAGFVGPREPKLTLSLRVPESGETGRVLAQRIGPTPFDELWAKLAQARAELRAGARERPFFARARAVALVEAERAAIASAAPSPAAPAKRARSI